MEKMMWKGQKEKTKGKNVRHQHEMTRKGQNKIDSTVVERHVSAGGHETRLDEKNWERSWDEKKEKFTKHSEKVKTEQKRGRSEQEQECL